jgi:hypothetical protein
MGKIFSEWAVPLGTGSARCILSAVFQYFLKFFDSADMALAEIDFNVPGKFSASTFIQVFDQPFQLCV